MSADLDKAIDRAVREMLDVEPPADLRAKVIARIDERPASGFRLPASGFRWLAVLGTAVALMLLVVLARHAEPPAQPPSVARAADQILPSPLPVPQDPSAIPAPRLAAARSAGVTPSFGDPGSPASGIEPLKTIAPIEVAPIARNSITPEPIGVRPLDPITEMQIAPLSPPDRRD